MKQTNVTAKIKAHAWGVVSTLVLALTNHCFDLWNNLLEWEGRLEQLGYDYEDLVDKPTTEKNRWFLSVWVLFPLVLLIDYGSIVYYIQSLADAIGGITGFLIKTAGILIFAALEIACAWMLASKEKPALRVFAIFLTVLIVFSPSIILFCQYIISDNRTTVLLGKTIVQIFLSLLIHGIYVANASKMIAGLRWYFGYLRRKTVLSYQNPRRIMKPIVHQLVHDVYPRLDTHIVQNPDAHHLIDSTLTNKAWYLKYKLSAHTDPFDYSDYSPHVNYSPFKQSGGTKYNRDTEYEIPYVPEYNTRVFKLPARLK